jgi:signal transduction histidine kinase
MVHVDRNQICRVIINLVMNAVSSMNGTGRLIFRTHRDAARQKAVLEIEDSGCGISKEHLPRIFDPFFTTKKHGEGTGLGLSTVYGLIQENKGSIEVKQTSEKGTTFRVELPLLRGKESGGQEA